MLVTTKAQRLALFAVYQRIPVVDGQMGECLPVVCARPAEPGDTPMSYLAFRRLASVGRDCVMLPWLGMWLGIEPDGYTHS